MSVFYCTYLNVAIVLLLVQVKSCTIYTFCLSQCPQHPIVLLGMSVTITLSLNLYYIC